MATSWALQIFREGKPGTDDRDVANRVEEAINASLRMKLGKHLHYTPTRTMLRERIDEAPVEDKTRYSYRHGREQVVRRPVPLPVAGKPRHLRLQRRADRKCDLAVVVDAAVLLASDHLPTVAVLK